VGRGDYLLFFAGRAGLARGKYILKIDGGEVAQGSHVEWAKGVALTNGPEFEQAEKLREIAVLKNTDFFNYWRPENWEFLYGSLTEMPSSARGFEKSGVRSQNRKPESLLSTH
jgi:hypothetical protein